MRNTTLKIIKNEFRESKRLLPECKPKALNPYKFDESPEHLIDFSNKGIKFFYSLIKM